MAITKILVVHGHLGKLIPYANNPEKTSLENAIDYATNAAKTETSLMQSTINCMANSIHQDMLATKRQWGKEGGVQAYHIIQSFAPGEVTPQIAHEIGCELARRVFGDRFEVFIATHLDKSHLHNHLVINSVSFADGRVTRITKRTLARAAPAHSCMEAILLPRQGTITVSLCMPPALGLPI